MGFVFDPNDPDPPYVTAFLDEDDYFDDLGLDVDEEEDDDDYVAVERAPRRAPSGPSRDDAGPRSRTTSMALGVGLFVEEPGGFGFSGGYERGPTGRPAEMSQLSRARVIELLEEAAGGLSI